MSIEAFEPDGRSSTWRHIDHYAVLPGHNPLLDRKRLRIGARSVMALIASKGC